MNVQPSGWPPADVERLLAERPARYERCPANVEFAREQLDRAVDSECQQVMFAAHRDDWEKANTDAYDGARKGMEMLLLAHGWRVRNAPGAHVATGDVAAAWLERRDPPAPRIGKAFNAARKARHAGEYPDPQYAREPSKVLRGYTQDNVRLVNLVRTVLGLEPREDLLPTAENLGVWRASL